MQRSQLFCERGTTCQWKVYECVTFSVETGISDFQCHAFQNWSNLKSKPFKRWSPESARKWKEVNVKRTSPRFRTERCFIFEISGENFYPNLQRFVWRRHVGAQPDGHNLAAGNQQKRLSRRQFCYENLNLSLEELIKHQSNILFIHELFR